MTGAVETVTPALLRDWALPDPGDSKHSRGHVLVIGGSRSTPGAAMLAGLAALRVGAGVLALAVPEPVAIPVAVAVPESGVIAFAESPQRCWDGDGLRRAIAAADAVLVGPGLDDPDLTGALLRGLTAPEVGAVLAQTPVALDAFALGVLADHPEWSPPTQAGMVLSPNRAEAARLLARDEGDLASDEGGLASEIAERLDATVSYQSAVADASGRVWQVAAGHPGLGTSGSGDVLSGAVAGLLARCQDGPQAAVWATYLHAVAGDRLAPRVGPLGFLARDLVAELPAVLTELQT
jgi:ADP-dependent NAD(P)H-hydrate dehydratase